MPAVGVYQSEKKEHLPITFTDAAAGKVSALIVEENNPNLKLRVFITGGGCSGFQYGFTFDEIINSDDMVIKKSVAAAEQKTEPSVLAGEQVTLLIDPMSFQYLIGAEIDYTEGLQGARFVIRNPNAKTTCGCGSSFSM